MQINKYLSRPTDPWAWYMADFSHIDSIVNQAKQFFESEIMGLFTPSPELYTYNLRLAISKQQYNPALEQILVCIDKQANLLLAYAWIGRGHVLPYAPEECSEAKVLHIDQRLSNTQRVRITIQAISHWLDWTRACGIPIIISSSIRQDQDTFMRIHEHFGFIRRGSIAYKKL